ncbi:MAG: tetratricopeptide repeat protein [Bacillota bacterium]
MRNNIILIFLIVIVLFGSWQLSTKAADDDLIKNYNELELNFFEGSSSLAELEERINNLIVSLNNMEDDYEKFYYLGKSNFLLGEIADIKNIKNESINYYEAAQKSAEKAIEYEENSDIYNLAGKSYIRLLNKKGAFYAISNGQKTFDLINKAIELDEKNYSAYNSLGIIYLQAPKIGGGDIEKSENHFKKALNSDQKINNFISYYYLAKVYKRKEDNNLEENFLKKAKNIFPDSYFLKNNQ